MCKKKCGTRVSTIHTTSHHGGPTVITQQQQQHGNLNSQKVSVNFHHYEKFENALHWQCMLKDLQNICYRLQTHVILLYITNVKNKAKYNIVYDLTVFVHSFYNGI